MTGFQLLAFRFVAVVLFAIATLTPGVALAQQPDLVSAGNRWTITAFNDEPETNLPHRAPTGVEGRTQ
jgi:hypothetical protein